MLNKFSYFFLLGFLILPFWTIAQSDTIELFPVRIILFHSETCAHCKDELEFLAKTLPKYPNVQLHDYELTGSIKNQSIFSQVIEREGLSGGVPVTIIGEDHFVGFGSVKDSGREIIGLIEKYSLVPGNSWLDDKLGFDPIGENSKISFEKKDLPSTFLKNASAGIEEQKATTENVQKGPSVFGKKINLEDGSSVFGLGALIALADGINPCMFSVLIFLLTYLLAIGSRKKALKAGLVFAATTFVVYFLLMLGIIKVIDVLRIEQYARWVIIAIALVAGLIMVKDFFFYGKWISLDIPKRFRPAIRALAQKGTVPSAIALAALSSIVELPCTSVLPLAYVSIIASRDLPAVPYLIWYNIFFILPLVAIILGVAFAWARVEKFEAWRMEYRKWMKLVAGVLLIALAVAFWQGWI